LRSFREHAPSDQNRRVTQQQLAERIGRDPTTLSRWETEERLPNQEDIEKVAQALGLSQWQQDRLRETSGYPVADVTTLHSQLIDVSKAIREIHHLLAPPSTIFQDVPGAALDQPLILPPSPYRGLSAFREEDAPFFFGREEFTNRLRAMVEQRSLVVVLGSSGSGKSSAVQAGLVPQLRQEGHWPIASFRPGIRPLHALAAALLTLLEPQQSETERLIEASRLEEALLRGELGLAEIAERILQKEPQARRLLLVVDQFEELYTLCPDPGVQQSFLDLLLMGVQEKRLEPTLTLVLTLRADFLGEALAYRPFSDALQDATLNLGPMTREELAQAIVAPAAQLGVAFEPGLLERILNDVGAESGNLPLLEFSLTQLWDRQQKRELSHQGYDGTGGVAGALAGHAELVYSQLDAEGKERARAVFLQLVRPGEGRADTRRLVTYAELGERNWQLVQRLADARLVVTDRTPDGQEVAELVHEALITGWDRLRQWVDADRTFRSW
jgi:transcriptional regulator with XRE-family HTH domain